MGVALAEVGVPIRGARAVVPQARALHLDAIFIPAAAVVGLTTPPRRRRGGIRGDRLERHPAPDAGRHAVRDAEPDLLRIGRVDRDALGLVAEYHEVRGGA